MEKLAIKDLIYGGLEEILLNKKYFYYSPVNSDYSHFTEEGKQAVMEFMGMMAVQVRKAEEAELDKRAKDIMLKDLKS